MLLELKEEPEGVALAARWRLPLGAEARTHRRSARGRASAGGASGMSEQARSGSSAAAGSTRWRASRTCARSRSRRRSARPRTPSSWGARGPPRRVPAAPRARPPHPAARAQLPGQHLRDEDARRRADPALGLRGGLAQGEYAPLDIVIPDQFVDRTHAAPLDLLRRRARGARRRSRIRSARPLSRRLAEALRRGGRHAATRAAPTSASRGRSSRRCAESRALPLVGRGRRSA